MKPSLGARLRAARLAANLGQSEVAAQYKLAKTTVWRWESDRASPDVKQIGLLAKLYRVSPAYLAYGDERATGRTTTNA